MLKSLTIDQVREIIRLVKETPPTTPIPRGPHTLSQAADYTEMDNRLREYLQSLGRPARTELVAFMLYGRGSDDFAGALKLGQSQSDEVQISYIAGKSGALDRYLEQALALAAF